MTKSEYLRLLRLLSSLETLLLFSGRQNLHAQQHIPDHLLEELTAMSNLLEREILDDRQDPTL